MNSNTLVFVALAVVAVALGLFLLAPTVEPQVAEGADGVSTEVGSEASSTEVVSGVSQNPPSTSSYWSPASSSSGGVAAGRYAATSACSSCGLVHTVSAPSATAVLVGGCGAPASPCNRPSCPVCQKHPAPCSSCGSVTLVAPAAAVPSCGGPASPCGRPSCSVCHKNPMPCSTCGQIALVLPASALPLSGGCGRPEGACEQRCERQPSVQQSCTTLCLERAGINRNLPPCFDECSMVQLHATIPHPLCADVRFEWSASGGSFVNPTSSDPLYFTPVVRLPGGQDVVITLKMTDTLGRSVTDHIVIHVRNTE